MIQIVTNYQFITDDGTSYSDTVNEVIDQDENADFPIRFQCPIGTVREQFFDFDVAEAFAQGNEGQSNTIGIFNRDDSNTCTIYVEDTAGDEYYVTLGPGEWHYLPLSIVSSGTGAAPPLVSIIQIDAAFTNAAGTLEILVFNNPGS